MRKTLLLLVALLFVSVGNAQAWFAADARTTEGAASVRIPVYNNSGGTLDAGDVVIMDMDASTGDNDLYVTTTTTADTALVVGVVWPADIASTDVGSVVVYGFAECDVNSLGVGENGPICTSTTAGAGRSCTNLDTRGKYAVSTVAITASSQGTCWVNP